MRRDVVAAGLLALGLAGCMPPSWGAAALLHPGRRAVSAAPALAHEDVVFAGDGVSLRGWRFPASGPRRGIIVHLHGVADNRRWSESVARREAPRGWEVVAYDSRAHGDSGGAACTYGFYEKRDLGRVLDAVAGPAPDVPVVLFGHSLGASVALQEAAGDPRVSLVIAVSPFSDLRTVARERAPFFASRGQVEEALRMAEAEGHFRVDDVSAVNAAAAIHTRVLLIHGADDRETRPAHAQRILAALGGGRGDGGDEELLLVSGRSHNDVMADDRAWQAVDRWLVRTVAKPRPTSPSP